MTLYGATLGILRNHAIGRSKRLIGTLLCVWLPVTVWSQISLGLPDLVLDPNKENQTFSIFAVNTGGGAIPVNGLQFELMVEDGGPAAGGSVLGPIISGITLVGPGSLFGGVPNNGDTGAGSILPQIFSRATSTAGNTTVPFPAGPQQQLIASVTFDTRGIAPGVYSYTAENSLNGASYFTDTSGVINPQFGPAGSLTVVPEPKEIAVAVGVGLGIGVPWFSRGRGLRSASRPSTR